MTARVYLREPVEAERRNPTSAFPWVVVWPNEAWCSFSDAELAEHFVDAAVVERLHQAVAQEVAYHDDEARRLQNGAVRACNCELCAAWAAYTADSEGGA